MRQTLLIVVLVGSALLVPVANADVPHLVRYQGQAVDSNGVPLEGPYTLTFRLYDAETAGVKLWEETQTGVQLAGGHFSVLLGQVTSLATMDWGQPRWLSVQVNGEPELTPRQRITSVPLAIRAEVAEQLVGGDISARVYNSTTISILNNINTPLTFNSERWDTDTLHSTTSNTGRLTATTAGKYLIVGHVVFAANTLGVRSAYLRFNGTTFIAGQMRPGAGMSNELSLTTHYDLAAGDYVELVVYQNSGGALNMWGSEGMSQEFGMVKIP